MQLGARGVSLLFSSGDGKAAVFYIFALYLLVKSGGVQTGSFAGVGDNTATCKAFGPTFPSGCPWCVGRLMHHIVPSDRVHQGYKCGSHA
jgi:hypothetical protein